MTQFSLFSLKKEAYYIHAIILFIQKYVNQPTRLNLKTHSLASIFEYACVPFELLWKPWCRFTLRAFICPPPTSHCIKKLSVKSSFKTEYSHSRGLSNASSSAKFESTTNSPSSVLITSGPLTRLARKFRLARPSPGFATLLLRYNPACSLAYSLSFFFRNNFFLYLPI